LWAIGFWHGKTLRDQGHDDGPGAFKLTARKAAQALQIIERARRAARNLDQDFIV
jgi:hypothetical protein